MDVITGLLHYKTEYTEQINSLEGLCVNNNLLQLLR